MPSRPKKVNEPNVKAAIKALLGAGEKVTNQTVKDKLGGGSLRDIAPLVRKVKAELEEAEAAASAVPEAPQDVWEAAQSIWALAYKHADNVATAERRDKAAAARRHEAEMAEADDQLGMLEAERDAAHVKVAELEAVVAEVTAQVAEQLLEIAGLKGRLNERDDIAQALSAKKTQTKKALPSNSRERPWEVMGISRATWYRRGKPTPAKQAQTTDEDTYKSIPANGTKSR